MMSGAIKARGSLIPLYLILVSACNVNSPEIAPLNGNVSSSSRHYRLLVAPQSTTEVYNNTHRSPWKSPYAPSVRVARLEQEMFEVKKMILLLMCASIRSPRESEKSPKEIIKAQKVTKVEEKQDSLTHSGEGKDQQEETQDSDDDEAMMLMKSFRWSKTQGRMKGCLQIMVEHGTTLCAFPWCRSDLRGLSDSESERLLLLSSSEETSLQDDGDIGSFNKWFAYNDYQEYKISEKDFKNLHPNDFEDLFLLNIQEKLNHLPKTDKTSLHTAVNMWIRNLVIRNRVGDLQLGIESYQTKINLERPNWDAADYYFKEDYTIVPKPRAVVYRDRNDQRKLMRLNELHKFSDGTLTRVMEKLDHMVKDFHLFEYNKGMETRKWSEDDKRRSKDFITAIEKRLQIRRIFRSLESFVGGRIRDIDYRLINRTT
ncbi:hypothetical protein Tco_1569445 [Tanacetum coccineum]